MVGIPHTPSRGIDRGALVASAFVTTTVLVLLTSTYVADPTLRGSLGLDRGAGWIVLVASSAVGWFGWRTRQPVAALLLLVVAAPSFSAVVSTLLSMWAGPGTAVAAHDTYFEGDTYLSLVVRSPLPMIALGFLQAFLIVPGLRLLRWTSLDARDHRLLAACAWTAVATLLCLAATSVRTVSPAAEHGPMVALMYPTTEAPVPQLVRWITLLVALGAMTVALTARIRMRARHRWFKDITAGAVAGWAVVERRGSADEARLRPLFAGTIESRCKNLLVHRDPGPTDSPYRDGPIETPVALLP